MSGEFLRLEREYSEYMVEVAGIRARVRDRFRPLINEAIEEETLRAQARFGTLLANSNLSVQERQSVIRTKSWDKYRRFIDAAETVESFTPPKPEEEQPVEDITVTRITYPGVPYAYEVDGKGLILDMTHNLSTHELRLSLADGPPEIFAEVQEAALAAIPEADKALYREEFGIEQD